MVKQTNSTVSIDNTNLANINTSYTTNWSWQNSVYETVYEILDGTTTISGTAYSKTNSSSCNSYFIIWRNNSVIKKEKITDGYYWIYERTIEFTNIAVQRWDLIRYFIECTFNGGDHQTLPIKMTINWNGYIYKKWINGKPRNTSIKQIGSKESITLLGIHSDNTRYNWQE